LGSLLMIDDDDDDDDDDDNDDDLMIWLPSFLYILMVFATFKFIFKFCAFKFRIFPIGVST